MDLNDALKQWAIEKLGVASDASDEDIKKAIAGALVDGTLSDEEGA